MAPYLPSGLQELTYALKPGERTPAFVLRTVQHVDLVNTYVRLSAQSGASPSYGVVRVTAPLAYVERRSRAATRRRVSLGAGGVPLPAAASRPRVRARGDQRRADRAGRGPPARDPAEPRRADPEAAPDVPIRVTNDDEVSCTMSNLNGHEAPEPPAVGRVGCPLGQEANVDEFYFWVAPGQLVEQTQIVRVPTRDGRRRRRAVRRRRAGVPALDDLARCTWSWRRTTAIPSPTT